MNKSHVGATTALRDGMRERRRREWLIPFAKSVTKQTARKTLSLRAAVKSGMTAYGRTLHWKMRPRSGTQAPQLCGRGIPAAARSQRREAPRATLSGATVLHSLAS
jgi:hypothetical protein